MPIPVYAFTGFLEAGKTKFIQDTLCDPRFNAGEKTLVLICEEGEEEFDPAPYPHKAVAFETIEQETVTTGELAALLKKYRAERVIVELNGMQLIEPFYRKMPPDWQLAQEVMFADANTILTYNTNLRSLVVDKLQGAELVAFNRMKPGADKLPLHKLARAVNRRIDIVYDYTDGTTEFDDMIDPLPFDLNAPIIEIKDDDYALFYRDVTEEPKKYAGKTVRFKAQVARLKNDRPGMFAPGRFVMTCCIEDISFMGLPCRYDKCRELKMRSWILVTAKIEVKYHQLFRGQGPILTAIDVQPADAAAQEVATF